mmetsp:Transcript_20677/g.66370  ORF Transcript_20677/g.66370 Transcript_20677/m.66370 type:complete len:329 (-) Transcript_20677:177-1163(-)
MRPSVRVPVLSVAITCADPSVSTAGSLRTSTLRFTISAVPSARQMVTHNGRPSGTALTASETATMIICSHDGLSGCSGSRCPRTVPTTKTVTHATIANALTTKPSLCSFCCSGVRLGPFRLPARCDDGPWPTSFPPAAVPPVAPAFSSAAIRPTRVRIPVSTTTASALPCAHVVEENAMLTGVSLLSSTVPSAVALFDTSTGSPVSSISLTLNPVAETRRTSAGTTLPVSRKITSPCTSADDATSVRSPSRSTVHDASPRRASASSALLAERSLWVATPALTRMMIMTATPSTHSPRASDATHAATSNRTISDANWCAKSFHSGTLSS